MRRFIKGDPIPASQIDIHPGIKRKIARTKSISLDTRRTGPMRETVGQARTPRLGREEYLLARGSRLDLWPGGASLSKDDGVIWSHSFGYPLAHEVEP